MKRLLSAATQDDGIGTLLSRAVADAREVAQAEIALQKARALSKVREAQSAVVMIVAALVLGSMMLTALVVGALLILQRALGPVWATVIVVGVLAAAASLLAWLAAKRFKMIFGGAA